MQPPDSLVQWQPACSNLPNRRCSLSRRGWSLYHEPHSDTRLQAPGGVSGSRRLHLGHASAPEVPMVLPPQVSWATFSAGGQEKEARLVAPDLTVTRMFCEPEDRAAAGPRWWDW